MYAGCKIEKYQSSGYFRCQYLIDGYSQGGNIICLLEENGKAFPLSWQSKKTGRIVRRTLTGEALALSNAVDEAVFLAGLYSELIFN